MNVPSISTGADWTSLLDDGETRARVEREALLPFIARQRWYAGKARRAAAATIAEWGVVPAGNEPAFLCLIDVAYADGGRERYFVPVTASQAPAASRIEREHPANVVARLGGAREGVLHDVLEDRVASALLDAIAGSRTIPMHDGEVRALPTSAFDATRGTARAKPLKVRRLTGEQSNTSLLYADRLILKVLRRVEPGLNPDYEIGLHLTERTTFGGAPRLAGALEYRSGTEITTVGVLHAFVEHDTNAWEHAVGQARRFLDSVRSRPMPPAAGVVPLIAAARQEPPGLARDTTAGYLDRAALIGRRTAALHLALAAAAGEPAFEPEPLTAVECRGLADEMHERAQAAVASVRAALDQLPAHTADAARRLFDTPAPFARVFDRLAGLDPGVSRIRIHGDYHLGQLLCTRSDVVIVDFEGEPLRSIQERRRKQPAMKDLAGMLRSFSYAAYAALVDLAGDRPDEFVPLVPWAERWQGRASSAFLRAYLQTAGGAGFVPHDPAALDILLRAFLLDKAFYELIYELNARPGWRCIPLLGILTMLGPTAHSE